jgi:hypothetical protein
MLVIRFLQPCEQALRRLLGRFAWRRAQAHFFYWDYVMVVGVLGAGCRQPMSANVFGCVVAIMVWVRA